MNDKQIMSILEQFNKKMYTNDIQKELDKTLNELIANGMYREVAEAVLNEMVDEMYI